jgi:hypothetical protein
MMRLVFLFTYVVAALALATIFVLLTMPHGVMP